MTHLRLLGVPSRRAPASPGRNRSPVISLPGCWLGGEQRAKTMDETHARAQKPAAPRVTGEPNLVAPRRAVALFSEPSRRAARAASGLGASYFGPPASGSAEIRERNLTQFNSTFKLRRRASSCRVAQLPLSQPASRRARAPEQASQRLSRKAAAKTTPTAPSDDRVELILAGSLTLLARPPKSSRAEPRLAACLLARAPAESQSGPPNSGQRHAAR